MTWKSKGVSDGSIKLPTTSGNSISPTLGHFNNTKFRVKVKIDFLLLIK